MNRCHFSICIIVLCGVGTFAHVSHHFQLDSCSLSCGSKPNVEEEIQELKGDSGPKGDRGHKGEIGPRGEPGLKGESGDPCECFLQNRTEINRIKSEIEARTRRGCPQSRFIFPRPRHSDYVRIKSAVPELTQATICAWITDKYITGLVSGSIFSYAIPDYYNSMLLHFVKGKNLIHIGLYSEIEPATNTYNHGIEHHVCLAFSIPDGIAKFYVEGRLQKRLSFQNRHPIPAGGTFILGQDQDSLLGGFDPNQCFYGEIRNFMVWDRILSDDEMSPLRSSSCSCVTDYIIALTPDAVQLEGAAASLPVEECPK